MFLKDYDIAVISNPLQDVRRISCEPAQGFTDDLKFSLYSTTEQFVRFVVFLALSQEEVLDRTSCFTDIIKMFAYLILHI